MPAPQPPTILVVDTNCFIRLLFSPLRPVLGATFAGYKLLTLLELAVECGPGTSVTKRNPWLLDEAVQQELASNCLMLRKPKSTKVAEFTRYFRSQGNSLLRKHCLDKSLDKVRELSTADAKALAAAQVLQGALATDEWPLGFVAERASDVEQVFTSVDVLHLMEGDGKIAGAQRVEVVSSWVQHGEKLPLNWRDRYRALFGEEPPNAQS